MIELNIRKLRSFVLVAELKSFRRAADTLSISSSALSTQIRELEEMVGVPLLRRTTRSVQVTNEGIRFLARSQQLIANADSLIKEFEHTASLQHGQVTIACVPTLTAKILPLAITQFSKRHPGITIRILDDGSRFIRRYVEDDEADFGIGKAPDNGRDFEITPLFQDFFVALAPNGHPLAGRKQIRFAELARFPFIRLKSSEGMISDLNKAVEKSGAVLNPVFELTHYYSIGRMVQAGFGITAMPQMALPMVNLAGLVAIPIVAPHVIRDISIIRRKGAELSPSAQKFLSILTKVASEVSGKNQ